MRITDEVTHTIYELGAMDFVRGRLHYLEEKSP
jgi:hypothetical protein